MASPNYDIETPEAIRFWGSNHVLNRVKSIIAFSLNEDNANDNLRRYGFTFGFRQRCLDHYKKYVNQPTMKNIPFSYPSENLYNFD
ncbi:hypothetical protein MLN87_07370 [Escherichia coli]|nr:hypothetical protein [Escherichia coli]MCN8204083.1 hypothetical protein [Escherichia coli]HAI3384505.1 hypothetical protein [Escherichia coli]HAL0004643.1 hypothetical protein [Escherichia coli]HAP1523985.1 hypothetical protein [Escherichia coli]